MAERVMVEREHLCNIADSIRNKAGIEDAMKPSEFAENIDNIELGDDINEYFEDTLVVGTTSSSSHYNSNIFKIIKKLPNDILLGNITNMTSMFYGCTALTEIPLFDTSNVTNMTRAFGSCSNLTEIPLLDTGKVTTMEHMFNGCASLKTIPQFNTTNVKNMYYMFGSCSNLTTIPLLDTSNVTNMEQMFYNCYKLTEIPLLDISKITSMKWMFMNCKALTTAPMFGTSHITNMYGMFEGCISLVNVPLYNTSNVTDMGSLFRECPSLIEIPQLDTSNVTTIWGMFYCTGSNRSQLTTIPMLDAGKVTNTGYTFDYCYELTNFGGLKDFGKAFTSTSGTGVSFSYSSKLTHESLMNIINNLYDLATAGFKTQKVTLHSTALAKLSAEEIAIATGKGWTIGS